MKTHIFESINIKLPHEKIYKRLGYSEGATKVSQEQQEEFRKYLNEALGFIKLRGAAARIAVRHEKGDMVSFPPKGVFKSRLLYSLLEGCEEMLCMAATAGMEIINAMHDLEKNDLTRSVVFDAVASEYVDACFDWIHDYFKQELLRENREILSKRVSCGYSDFSIENQKTMYEILGLKLLGIKITDSFMLMPEKSATAITGIRRLPL